MRQAATVPWVLTSAYIGIRSGEAVALRVRDVEFLRGRLSVHANAVQLGVDHAVGPTKGRTARSVPVAAFLLDELSVRCQCKARDTLVSPDRTADIYPARNPPVDGSALP
jgi:integrase